MKLLKIKWENIICIGLAIFFIVANTLAFIEAGFNFTVFMFELVLDVAVLYAMHYITKNLRKSFLEERK